MKLGTGSKLEDALSLFDLEPNSLRFTLAMESKLDQCSALAQKDKGPAFVSLIQEIVARPESSTVPPDLHLVVDTVVNKESVGIVVGRHVLSELVKILGEGAIKDNEIRKRVVEDTLATVQPRLISYEEQVSGFSNDYNIILTALR